MPLDNTAKLSDIITALQTMEGINAKADLASVIGSPAQDTDTMATLVSLIQQSKNELAIKMDDGSTGAEPLRTLVGNLVMGKKWASGSISSYGNIEITGLDFRPKVIILESRVKNSTYTYSEYTGTTPNVNNTTGGRLYRYGGGTWGAFLTGSPTITDSGFTMPTGEAQTINYEWVAFE